MYFLGIDQAAINTGFVLLERGTNVPVVQRLINTKGYDGGYRLQFLFSSIRDAIGGRKVSAAALEGYSMDSVHRAMDLGEIGGIVRLALVQENITYLVVPPSSLKKYVTGRGDADKDKMMDAVARKWGVTIPQNDVADAYGLAHLARASVLGGTRDRAEAEVLQLFKGGLTAAQLMKTSRGSRT